MVEVLKFDNDFVNDKSSCTSLIFQRDSTRELDFYRKVKTHFQNVEMHSILQAKAINATGMYLVGNMYGVSKDFKV